jgi:hypothetical protein
MTNTPVTIVLREGGTEEPEWTLSVQGSADRARVELRTSRVRMVIARETADSDVMSQVLGSADDLEEIQGRLRRLADEVPEPTEAMLLQEMPYDVHTELLTTLECVAEDNLEEAIEKLRAAAAVTPDQLREHWERSSSVVAGAERPGTDAE